MKDILTNAILIILFAGLDSECILEAYKKNFNYLVSKGFKPKVNMMDNQATKAIKAYLTPQQVTLQLAEPHNHRVNAAEQAIQTFKNRFLGTLGTTDSRWSGTEASRQLFLGGGRPRVVGILRNGHFKRYSG